MTRWYARINNNPVSSPAAPAAGCSVAAAIPVTSHNASSSSTKICNQPWLNEGGAPGCTPAKPGRPATVSQIFGLYFMVHEPNG